MEASSLAPRLCMVCMSDPVCSLELEFFVLGRSCPEVLRAIRSRYATVPFSGKGGGFWMDLPGPAGPVLFKVSGDGPICTQDLVLEVALPETNAPSAAFLVQEYVLPWLSYLEAELGAGGSPPRFLMGPEIHGHRSAFQVNLSLGPVDDIRSYYHRLAPLVLTVSCVTGPGGLSPAEGYVLAPRLANHCRPGHYLGSDSALRHAPVAYPRWRDYGRSHRAHFSLEYPRTPGAIYLSTGILSLATLAYEVDPHGFNLEFREDPITAARTLNRSLDGREPVPMERAGAASLLRGLELQEIYLEEIVGPLVTAQPAAPAWAHRFLQCWREAIQARRAGASSPYSDFSLKRPYLAALSERAGLPFGSPRCQSAYALCAALLHAQIDLDELFAEPLDRLPLDERRAHLRRHLEAISPAELRTAYRSGLREALLFEIAWTRLGPESASEQLAPALPTAILAPGDLFLAPRARARARILQTNPDDPWLSADWDRIETTECFAYSTDPEDEAFTDDGTGEPLY